MKKIVFIAQLLLFAIGVQVQDTATHGYRSFFGSESTVWHAGLAITDNPNLENKVLHIDGDTIINGITYKKIYMRHRWSSANSIPVGNDFFGVCREDTLNGRLWIKTPYLLGYDLEEMLIADMSLEMGDDGVDTIYYDSLGRKVIIYEHLYYPFLAPCKITEGLGPEYVIFIDHFQILYLMCVYHNGTRESFESSALNEIFSNKLSRIDYDNCWVEPRLGILINSTGDFNIYPNPCSDVITIKMNSKGYVVLSDIVGREIESQYGDLVSFEMSDKKRGVYFITTTLSGEKITKAIIKNN